MAGASEMTWNHTGWPKLSECVTERAWWRYCRPPLRQLYWEVYGANRQRLQHLKWPETSWLITDKVRHEEKLHWTKEMISVRWQNSARYRIDVECWITAVTEMSFDNVNDSPWWQWMMTYRCCIDANATDEKPSDISTERTGSNAMVKWQRQ